MPKYLFIGKYNADGSGGVLKAGGSRRVEVAKKLAQSLGGSIEAFYFAFGPDDFYTIGDLPDNAAAATVSLTVAASGVSIRTVVLVDAAEVDAASHRSVEYTPPGG